MPTQFNTPEHQRLEQARTGEVAWKSWGPYLSERQWGTVREDYSAGGDAWNYFTHDQARSRAYRWGEDGIAGISDERQRLCLALALWNGRDPIIKERMFGLANSEGNHGEDVKEYWFYLDSAPTHSYMKLLYKYPQGAYPYDDIIHTNGSRGKLDPEYELLDTGIFDEDRYFDVVVEYAKVDHDDIIMRVTAHNRGPDAATLHLLPTLWFRNTWSWGDPVAKPSLAAIDGGSRTTAAAASHPELGEWRFEADGSAELLFCENETNSVRLFGSTSETPYPKDAINDYVVEGRKEAVNPERQGTKVAAHHTLEIPAGASAQVAVRLRADGSPQTAKKGTQTASGRLLDDASKAIELRQSEADEFYATVIPATLNDDAKMVMRQALSGMLWSKQYYEYNVHRWLREHGVNPWNPDAMGASIRNVPWYHMVAGDIISMPDKWEYPWFAAWDLAFHAAPLSLVDVDFAKEQVQLLLRTRYMHPNGQIPAYEWNFSDVNPPVTAWAALYVYEREAQIRGEGDHAFLKRVFDRLLTNFTWWVNRKDPDDRNLFQGGFLGLDNIGIFDRSAPLPGGGTLEQADGTAWMALYCQWMLQISVELSKKDPAFADMAYKFLVHFEWISIALNPPEGDTELWDEADGFYYDDMRTSDGQRIPLPVRSLVGLLPMCAATVFDGEAIARHPEVLGMTRWFLANFSDALPSLAHLPGPSPEGHRIVALVDEDRLKQILSVMLDENEFLGPHGIRAISRRHLDEPVIFDWAGQEYNVHYLPAESDTGMFGGNSNWRGPVWFPMNLVIIRALAQLHRYYGDRVKVECPTGSGRMVNLHEIAVELSTRLARTFLNDTDGKRPVFGGMDKFQNDPHWHDNILFHEYFHGDNGAGIGASHQTGWTGTVALLFLVESELHTATADDVGGLGDLTGDDMRLPTRPTIYEINTAVWLERLGRGRGQPLTLSEVPASEWDALAALPVDAVWLMGVWQRSPAGLEIALRNPNVVAGNEAALPDLHTEDVIGSPYCVHDYVVDARFGGTEALVQARKQLADRGLGLMLDYVPNHVAPDHPWLTRNPDCFLSGTDDELQQHPDAFIRVGERVLANGRDPYFPAWPDVVQVNAFSPALRNSVAEMLIGVGGQCDGLRCDMAMLMTNEVFARTWGQRAGAVPRTEFWPELIGRVKAVHPDLLFMAEAYWDMEWTLQQQGFDLCYDKRLYDRLVNDGPDAVRGHLHADTAYQERLIRFIENHDEPRAAQTFPPGKARAAAVVMSTLEGARLFHDGQFDGFMVHIPVFLTRGPDEAADSDLHAFYERLLAAVAASDLRDGQWALCNCEGWPDNDSCRQLVSWAWSTGMSRHLVVVNLADRPAQARVRLPWNDLSGRDWSLSDRLSEARFERAGDELAGEGLYVELDAWAFHFLAFQ